MKKQFLFLYTLLFSITGFAQQEPLFTQYKILGYTINPAMAGSQEMQELRLGYRSQWRNFPGAPTTATISFQGAMDEKSAGGILAFTDIMGPTQRSGLQLSYAFHVPIGQPGISGQTKLSFGLGGKVLQYHFRAESTYFQDRSDPAIMEAAQGMVIGDAAFGAYLYNDRFFAGFSAPNILQSDFYTGVSSANSRSVISRLYRHYFAFFGYRFDYSQLSIEPSVMIKKVHNTPYQIEGNVRFLMLEEKVFVGLSYRTDWLMSMMFGVHAKNLQFTYSYDFMTPNAEPGLLYGGTHEFTLGIDIGGPGSWRKMYSGE